MNQARRIVFATFGSLGDLHPYLAIARALAAQGHVPVVATTDIHGETVEAAGVAFAAVRPDGATLGEPAAIVRRLFNPFTGPRHLIRDLVMAHLRDALADVAPVLEHADLAVIHPLAFAARIAAEERGLPWMSTVLSPMSIPSAIAPPRFPGAPWLRWIRRAGGPAANARAFGLVRMVAASWERPLRELRAERGVPAQRGSALFEGQFSPYGTLALFPQILAEPQADWPAGVHVCGAPMHDGAPPDPADLAALDAFLDAGEAPLVFALGSSVVLAPGDFFERAIAVAQRLRRRTILVAGPGGAALRGRVARDGDPWTRSALLALPQVPYARVFPRSAVVVHTAGIGTLTQALAAGRPQLIVPVAFDQPDNAERAVRLGVARSLPFRRASVDAMTAALRLLLDDPAIAARAQRIGLQLRDRDPAREAVALLLAACRARGKA
jgi:UDP:flavonoid glycosyltransferase YjiC (YdhE family)